MTITSASAQNNNDGDLQCRAALKIFINELDETLITAEKALANVSIKMTENYLTAYLLPRCELSTVDSVFKTSRFFKCIQTGHIFHTDGLLVHITFATARILVRMVFMADRSEFAKGNGVSVSIRKVQDSCS